MAVYLVWKEVEQRFAGRSPDKYGEPTPDFRPVEVRRRALWSIEETPERIAQARAYIAGEGYEGYKVVLSPLL